jgi:hypothetical protein
MIVLAGLLVCRSDCSTCISRLKLKLKLKLKLSDKQQRKYKSAFLLCVKRNGDVPMNDQRDRGEERCRSDRRISGHSNGRSTDY